MALTLNQIDQKTTYSMFDSLFRDIQLVLNQTKFSGSELIDCQLDIVKVEVKIFKKYLDMNNFGFYFI